MGETRTLQDPGELHARPSVSVIVPTFRRPRQLHQCLAGIRAQSRPPDEIVVIRRQDDLETAAAVSGADDLLVVTVEQPGVLQAMNAGVAASSGQVLAFVDDDAVPRADWLLGLLTHLDVGDVGGVGGRDVVHTLGHPDRTNDDQVGVISAWGKLVGNHHLGSGPARPVEVLKAVNMAFRREAFSLPRTLRGAGAQVHFEVAVGLAALNAGWRLVYDPSVLVDHYPGPRFDTDRRDRPDAAATRDAAYNLVRCLISLRPAIVWRRAAYGLLIGDAMTPGLARAVVAMARREWAVARRLPPSMLGQVQALWDFARESPFEMTSGNLDNEFPTGDAAATGA